MNDKLYCDSNNQYERERDELLTKLGFIKIVSLGVETLKYKHRFLFPNREFNFIAYNMEGMIKLVWETAYNEGYQAKLREIKQVLDIDHID